MKQASFIIPTPSLVKRESLGVSFYTDEALFDAIGVRIAFTCRTGGFSQGGYTGLNLGSHVGDAPEAVALNRQRALQAIGASDDARLAVLDQVHGSEVVVLSSADDPRLADGGYLQAPIASADALVVLPQASGVAAMLMYADCTPVILVSPTGAFAVVHAGWRGAVARIAGKAAESLLEADSSSGGNASDSVSPADLNAYIGPCIRRECFEVGGDVRSRFSAEFGDEALYGEGSVDLAQAVRMSLVDVGVSPCRIADLGACTVCDEDEFFSYRASGGVCGRHAAIGFSS